MSAQAPIIDMLRRAMDQAKLPKDYRPLLVGFFSNEWNKSIAAPIPAAQAPTGRRKILMHDGRMLDVTPPAKPFDERELIEAAEAIVARWYSPKWKDEPHTAVLINRLRDALASQPVAALPTDKNTAPSKSATGAKMPCGAMVTNVYEAYEAGRVAALPAEQAPTDQKDWRKMLTDIGGYENGLIGVPADGVRLMVDEIEALRAALAARQAPTEIMMPVIWQYRVADVKKEFPSMTHEEATHNALLKEVIALRSYAESLARQVVVGTDCPSLERLDDLVDKERMK